MIGLGNHIRNTKCIKIPVGICQALDRVFAPNINRIQDVECPIFVVHGTDDKLVPIRNSHALVAATKTKTYYPPLFVEAGHNDIEAKFSSLVISSMQDFFQFCMDRVQNKERAQCQYDASM